MTPCSAPWMKSCRSWGRSWAGLHVIRPAMIVLGITGRRPSPTKGLPWLMWRAMLVDMSASPGTSSPGNCSLIIASILGRAYRFTMRCVAAVIRLLMHLSLKVIS